MNCGTLPNPDNGVVDVPITTEDGIATYSCSEGHILVGVVSRVCQPDGTWSDQAPTCRGKQNKLAMSKK